LLDETCRFSFLIEEWFDSLIQPARDAGVDFALLATSSGGGTTRHARIASVGSTLSFGLPCQTSKCRCNGERSLCGACGMSPRFRSGCSALTANTSGLAEVLEPAEQIARRKSVARHLGKKCSNGPDGGLLHTQVDLDVPMRGRELGVAEPRRD